MKFYIRGGVGDFLQCLPVVLLKPEEDYYIHTHYTKAKEFFNEFGLHNIKVFCFKDAVEHDEQVDQILADCDPKVKTNFHICKRMFYSKLGFNEIIQSQADNLINSFKNKKPIIGIHPFGSDFSKNIYSKFNLPVKFIPADVISKITSNENYNYLLFGSANELESYELKETDNLKFVSFYNILISLACVNSCKKFIGTDSCFKTMSSMSSIPTYCIVGNFDDQTRDVCFIDQYVTDGIMKIFKYDNIENQKQEIIDFFVSSINE